MNKDISHINAVEFKKWIISMRDEYLSMSEECDDIPFRAQLENQGLWYDCGAQVLDEYIESLM